jgi:hypothetical protein
MIIGANVYNRSATGHKHLKLYTWESVFEKTKQAVDLEGYQFNDGRGLVNYPLEKAKTNSYFTGLSAPVFEDEFYKYVNPIVRIRVDHGAWLNDFNRVAGNYILTGLTGAFNESTLSDWQNSVSGPNREDRLGKAYAAMIDMHTRYYNARGLSHDAPAVLFQNIFTSQAEHDGIFGSNRDFPPLSSDSSSGPDAPWLSVYYHPSDALSMHGQTYGIAEKDILAISRTSMYTTQGLSGARYAINTIFSSMKSSIDLRSQYTSGITYPKYIFSDDETTTVLLPSIREYSSYDTILELNITGYNPAGSQGQPTPFDTAAPYDTYVYGFTNASATNYVAQGSLRQMIFHHDVSPWIDPEIEEIEYGSNNIVYDPNEGSYYKVNDGYTANNLDGFPSDFSEGYTYYGDGYEAKMQICRNAANQSQTQFINQWTLSGPTYIATNIPGTNRIPILSLNSSPKYYTKARDQSFISQWADKPQSYANYQPYSNVSVANFGNGPYYWTKSSGISSSDYNRYPYNTLINYFGKTADLGQWNQHINDPRATTYKFFDKYTLFELWGQTGPYVEGNKDSTAGCNYSPYQYTPEYTLYSPSPYTGSAEYTQTNVKYYYAPHGTSSIFDKNPYFFNFILSLHEAHHIWLMDQVFAPAKTHFPNIKVGTDYSSSMGSKRFLASGEKPFAVGYCLDILAGHTGTGFASPDITGISFCDFHSPNLPMGIATKYTVNINSAFRGTSPIASDRYNGINLTGSFANNNLGSYGGFLDSISLTRVITGLSGDRGLSGDMSITAYNGLTSNPKESYLNVQDFVNYRFKNSIETAKNYNNLMNYFDETRSAGKPLFPWLTINESDGPVSTTNLFTTGTSVLPVSTEYDTFNYIRTMLFDHNTEGFIVFKMPQLIYRVGETGVSGAIKMLDNNDRFSRVDTADYEAAYSVYGVPDSHGRSPVSLFSASVTSGQPRLFVNYINQTLSEGGISGYNWYLYGNTADVSSKIENPAISYDTPGTYTITLEAYNQYGSDTYTINNYINVLPVSSNERSLYSVLNTDYARKIRKNNGFGV